MIMPSLSKNVIVWGLENYLKCLQRKIICVVSPNATKTRLVEYRLNTAKRQSWANTLRTMFA